MRPQRLGSEKRSLPGVGSEGEAIVHTWNAGDVINSYNLRC